ERIEVLTEQLRVAGEAAGTPEQSIMPAPVAQGVHMAHERAVIAGVIERRIPLLSPLATVLLALGSLLLAHFIIVIHSDLALFWLHVASLILPFVFGFLYRQKTNEYLSYDLLAGILLAAGAIVAMSAEVDKVPVLPTDRQGWLEYLEY